MPGLILVPVIDPILVGPRDVRFGRVRLVAPKEGLTEELGGAVEVVGDRVTPGERKPKGFNPALVLWGHQLDSDPYAAGARTRRQVRALVGNPRARNSGVYFSWTVDPELNGWLKFGGATISDPDGGGPPYGSYEAALADCYLVATARTHVPARRLELLDLRTGTAPRDYLGRLYSTAYSALTPTARHWLPGTISDLKDQYGVPVASTTVDTIEGAATLRSVDGRSHGEVLRFEWPEDSMLQAAVLVLDRRGSSPVFTTTGDRLPQDTYGWEEVYGNDYPLTVGDVPVLQNGRCRVRWVSTRCTFAIDQYDSGTGLYVERDQVAVRTLTGGDALTATQLTALRGRPTCKEWTEDRAVVLVPLEGAGGVADVYITLQRGWAGPRFEVYANAASPVGVELLVATLNSAAAQVRSSAGSITSTGLLSFGSTPWGSLGAASGNGDGMAVAITQDDLYLGLLVGDTTVYGASRGTMRVAHKSGSTVAEGYVRADMLPFSGVTAASQNANAAELGLVRLYDSRVTATHAER